MYKNLIEQLTDAVAESQFVIAINIDIREFTEFYRGSDSAEVALFIRTMYLKTIKRIWNRNKNQRRVWNDKFLTFS
jgi:hypothetical protein